MFERSSNISVLKTRIRHLEQRKERILAQSLADSNGYWLQSDLARIETQLSDAQAELARTTEEITG
jgi:hypothetical protein